MNTRLLEIIKYKTGGRQREFADLLGWTPQYLAKLLKGENFGITPVMTIVSKLPDINARWFLTGEGDIDFIRGYGIFDFSRLFIGNASVVEFHTMFKCRPTLAVIGSNLG